MSTFMIIGTSHFVSVWHARRYYRDYGYRNLERVVRHKIINGEIHIGKPHLEPGESLRLVDGGTRYTIVRTIERETP